MSRFYCLPDDVKKDYIHLEKDEAHHVYKVMRLRPQDRITVFDGRDKEYRGLIIEANPKSVVIKIEDVKTITALRKLRVSLAVSLPKGKKMDFIIQKCTELGVGQVMPIETKRSLINLDKAKEALKLKRWQQIAKDACKQCGRTSLTKIDKVMKFEALLDESKNYDLVIMPCFYKEASRLKDLFDKEKPTKESKILVIIGPEGGFSREEINQAKNKNFYLVSLGQRTLRTETASIYMMAVLSFYLEQ